MSAAPPALRLDLDRARAHWHLRAGLAVPLPGDADEVIARTGWLRTLGGVDVYLAARARVPGLSRAGLDALVEASRLRVIPAVRGCIYLVPAAHVPLALRVAAEVWRKGADRDLARAGSSWREVDEIAGAVARALARGALTTDAIRRALPAGAVRSLGEAGKQVGLSSPLPVALRRLEMSGVIERTLEGGRLDTERYLWRLAPRAGDVARAPRVPDDALDRLAALARIFCGHAGPATVGDLATWAGVARRDARAAIARAALVPVAVAGYADEAWVVPEDVEALRAPPEPTARVALLAFEDGYCVAHGGPRWLVDPAHHARRVRTWGNTKGATLGDATHLQTRTFCVGDRLGGIWEMDPDAGSVLWASFAPLARAARAELDRLATETGRFLDEQLGHARSFSLDTVDGVRERAAEVARVASGRERLEVVTKPKVTAKPRSGSKVTARSKPRSKAKVTAKTKPKAPAKSKPQPRPKAPAKPTPRSRR